ncbi:MAG: hypothetical protein AB7S41_03710 [Parvibaculaceae bacterium]
MPPARVNVVDADSGPLLPIVEGGGCAIAVIWPGMGASMRSLHHIVLEPGSATVPLKHPMEAVYYAIRGGGTVGEPGAGPADPIVEGSMVHVDGGTPYVFRSDAQGLELIGGPCPADASLYPNLG